MKKILIIMLICLLFSVSSCKCGENNKHEHEFIEGKCECGEVDPNYSTHTHNYIDGKCECGEVDPNYSEHTHNYVDGKCNCGVTDSNYVEVEYTFISKEEIEKAFDIYYSKVNLKNPDGSSNTFVICENNNYFYYNFKNSEIVLDKENNDIYVIDNELKVKTLDVQLSFDKDANKNVLIDLLSEHIDKVDKKYTKVENQ